MPDTPIGPLQGIRVIDLTTVMLGPFCTQILGEMGADVIKIEPPGGDIGRWTGTYKTKGMSSAYLMKGRNNTQCLRLAGTSCRRSSASRLRSLRSMHCP